MTAPNSPVDREGRARECLADAYLAEGGSVEIADAIRRDEHCMFNGKVAVRALLTAFADTELSPTTDAASEGDDPDALSGCADDQVWADVPIEALREVLSPTTDASERMRKQGQAESFAAAVQWLRDRSAMKPPATLFHAATILANQMERVLEIIVGKSHNYTGEHRTNDNEGAADAD